MQPHRHFCEASEESCAHHPRCYMHPARVCNGTGVVPERAVGTAQYHRDLGDLNSTLVGSTHFLRGLQGLHPRGIACSSIKRLKL